MSTRSRIPATVLASVCALAVAAAPAAAAFPDDGKRWKQVKDTTLLTWSQMASVCPRDGESRCWGTVGGRDTCVSGETRTSSCEAD